MLDDVLVVRRVAIEVEGVKVVELDDSRWADTWQTLHVRVDHGCVHPAHVVAKHSLIFLHNLRILEIKTSNRHLTCFRSDVSANTTFFGTSSVVAERVHHWKVLATIPA